jgi:hypothetical protein
MVKAKKAASELSSYQLTSSTSILAKTVEKVGRARLNSKSISSTISLQEL